MDYSFVNQFPDLNSSSAECESIKAVSIESDKTFTNDVVSSPSQNRPGIFFDCLKDVTTSNEFITTFEFMNDFYFDDLTEAIDELDDDSDSCSDSDITDQSYGSNFSVHDGYYLSPRLSPIMEEPESPDCEDYKTSNEHPSSSGKPENEDKYENDDGNTLQNNSQIFSPCLSFYSESFIPRPSCVSSVVVPAPLITNITSAFHKRSPKNVQQSFSYLDFHPSAVEKKPRKRAWARICRWFHGRQKFLV
ncbi:unnamed protein product [Ambrosiozyma monospora]|uniref:Unnamed protein product n=1 Tax=Ambrosiozyma monospora TaxID=43982 RepID=A0ACB5TXG0_AMBMO|nr:unnamed protein product [Ambrosiozyma monospora]